MAAWEDFRDRGWIKTFNLRGGARLKTAGRARCPPQSRPGTVVLADCKGRVI
jgi:hypothetical protein